MREIRVPLVLAVCLGVVLAGLGARSIYYRERVVAPLAAAAAELPGVASVEVVDAAAGGKDVVARLVPGAPLESAYVALDELARAALGRSYGRLRLEDRRTPVLERAFHAMHFAVHEGIATGRFAAMAGEVEARLAAFPGVQHRVRVGDRHVFVELAEGDAYLHEVIPRPPAALARYDSQRAGGA